MTSAGATRRPRGARTSAHELAQRLGVVEDLMVAGFPTRKILEELERQKKWPRPTVERYIRSVRERWRVERDAERATDVEASIARLTMLSSKAERKEAWGAVGTFEKLLVDIRGVRAPDRHDHRVAAIVQHQTPTPTGEALKLVDDASDAFLDELERMANKKLALLPAHDPVIDHEPA